ncbi:MAG: type IV pilus assembly protein PilM [Bacteriovoracaceae bacterium]|nr:type IV pilus assembly protein PilM [Bacteriovoracaceae bacterium]
MAGSLIDSIVSKILPSSGNLVGVDIGSGFIKVCELSGGMATKYKLEKFSMLALTEAAIIEDEIQKKEEIIAKIKTCIDKAGIKNSSAALGLYGPNTIIKRMQVPEGTDEEIEDHILWESEQYIPFGADESQISHFVLGDNEGGGKDVILSAAREDTVVSFEELLTEAKMTPKVVEIGLLSLSNLFEVAYSDKLGDFKAGVAIIDFGAQSTKVMIYKNGAPIFCKEIPMGGALITEEVQRQMGLSFSDAEDLKINGDESGNLPEEIVTIVDAHLNTLYDDIKKSLNFFLSNSNEEPLKHCLVTGGSSRLPGLIDGLEGLLEINVEFFNPFRKIKPSSGFSNEELERIATQGCVALGLAMRSL